MDEDRQGLLQQQDQNREAGNNNFDFEAPEIQEDDLPGHNTNQGLKSQQ